jgi:hypothetical protein
MTQGTTPRQSDTPRTIYSIAQAENSGDYERSHEDVNLKKRNLHANNLEKGSGESYQASSSDSVHDKNNGKDIQTERPDLRRSLPTPPGIA